MKRKEFVTFYAYHAGTNNPNYNFKFKVNDRKNALYCAKKFKAKAAWYVVEINGVVTINDRLNLF